MDRKMLDKLLRSQTVHAVDRTTTEGDWLSINDLLRAHNLQQESSEHASASTVEETKSSTPLRQLQPMLVGDLQLGWRHKGRVLYGELSVEPFKMVAVHTIVADEAGQAVNLSVYNALPCTHSPHEIWALFPKGLKVAIKEPYFKIAMDGSHMIRVDDPTDFIRNPKVRKGSGSRISSPSPSPSPSSSSSSEWRVLLYAGDLRSRGNQAFAGQDWKQAIQLYTDTVQFLLLSTGTCPSTISLEIEHGLALAFSNRAEARLRQQHFEAAKVDAGKALKLWPHHVKSIYRRGRALHGLHQYKEAVLCFKEVLDVRDGNPMSIKDLTEELNASELCNKQSKTGEYDLVCMWREVKEEKEPVCGEFIGPVEIGPASERALGRGLLVTRDVEPGDLLLVSIAVAFASGKLSSKESLQEGIKGKYMRSVHPEDLVQQVLDKVLDRARSSTRFREQVYSLAANNKKGLAGIEGDIPTMDVFSAELESTTGDEAIDDIPFNEESIDIGKIHGVIKTNALKSPKDLHVGLWFLPSFINNSCTPNSCWMMIGKEALFVRANRHLTKGQEVTISYLGEAAVPYSMRALCFRTEGGFECRCQRCSFEKSLEHFLKPLDMNVAVQFSNISAAAEVVESLEWGFQNITAFENEQQKHWLRTSYSLSFVLTVHDPSLQERMRKFAPLETLLRAVQETAGGSEEILEMVRAKVHDSECSSRVKVILASMYMCLYGKQPPAALPVLLALRASMAKKNFDVEKGLDTVVASSSSDNQS